MDIEFPREEYKNVQEVAKDRHIRDQNNSHQEGSFFGESIARVDTARSHSISETSTCSTVSTTSDESSRDDSSVEAEDWDKSIWIDVPDAPVIRLQQSAEELIEKSQELFKQQPFDPQEVKMLKRKIQNEQKVVEEMIQDFLNVSSLEKKETALVATTLTRLRKLHDYFIIKEKMLFEYLDGDPFSDKNVLYPRKVYAETARLMFEKKLANVPEIKQEKMRYLFNEWYEDEIYKYDIADPTTRSHAPEFYLNKENQSNPLKKYNAERIVKMFNRLFSISTSVAEVEEAFGKAINEHLDWETMKRDMIFSLRGETRAYTEISTPLSESHTAVGADLRDQGIRGIIPSVRNDGRAPINARMTQLFRLEGKIDPASGEYENKILLHERQQHGINDHFGIQDRKERHRVNVSSMRQLIQSAAEVDTDFIRDAIKNRQKPHQVFYINTNLTTPTWTPRGPKNDEKAYSRHQEAAMRAVENNRRPQSFSVLNPDAPEERVEIDLEVVCIDFHFPVNYAISDISEDPRALDPGMFFAWFQLQEHNRKEFIKLCGSLDHCAPITGLLGNTFDKLCQKAKEDPNGDASKIKKEIEEQVEHLRKMFENSAYQRAERDRFKMPRHIDLLVNAFRRASELVDDHQIRVVNAGGCMSGKDREGVAGAESEAATIIQDLGGSVEPGQGGRYDEETQAIYDHCITGVVYNTRHVTGIGGSKNAKEIANQMSDPYAKVYAQGGSQLVNA